MTARAPTPSRTGSGDWELRASVVGPVLRGRGDRSAIPADLEHSLTEWARVVDALAARDGVEGDLVADRGRRLARRVAETTQVPVHYVDPVHGRRELIAPREATPWATGLTVSLAAAVVMVVALAALSEGLATVGVWLAVLGNVVVAVGLAPSLWLLRGLRTWRWVSYGAVLGIVSAWIGMFATLPS